jgi:3,4-dihydroxy 2-butanone 4-phosphate synthase/GTP cyclohydrolase II
MRALGLSLITGDTGNQTRFGTAFATPIDAREGVGSGMSAFDRARAIAVAIADGTGPADLIRPGRLQTLRAVDGGVLARRGHTEAAVDLARLAGLKPAGVICEIMKDDGTMARLPDLIEFAQRHGLRIGAIADLIHYRSRTERLVERAGERPIHTAEGDFRLVVFRDKLSDATHLALTLGEITPERDTLVRVHEPLSVIDLLDLASRPHSWTSPAALAAIRRAGCGVLVLLHRPESAQELRLRAVTDQPPPETRMDLRNYGIGAQILRDLGVGRMRLLARPRKMPSMAGFGLEVTSHEDPPPPSEARRA